MKEFSEGVYYDILIDKEGAMVAGRGRIMPGYELRPHHHTTEEVYTIVSGEGWMSMGGAAFAVKPGQIIYIPSDMTHSLRAEGFGELMFSFVFPKHSWKDIEYHMEEG